MSSIETMFPWLSHVKTFPDITMELRMISSLFELGLLDVPSGSSIEFCLGNLGGEEGVASSVALLS